MSEASPVAPAIKDPTYQASQKGIAKSDERLQIKLFSPGQTFFEGQAKSLSARNATGPFDVLPGHVNFLTLLLAGDIHIDDGFRVLTFPVGQAVLKVTGNIVTVFLGA